MEASCQCGAVKFDCPLQKPTCIYICHCTQCRRQSASAFGISAIFPQFEINLPPADGVIGEYSRPTETGKKMRCYFCTKCGTRLIHARDGVNQVSVKGGCLKDLSKELMDNAVHIWVSEAVVDIPESSVKWPGEPPDD